jgi:hypothetical protein
MDAFEAAFRLPNILRRMFAEGAFAQAFVPIFAEYRGSAAKRRRTRLVGRVGTLLALVLLLVPDAAACSPRRWLVYCLASGFAHTPGKVELTADMIRIVFPVHLLRVARLARRRRAQRVPRSRFPPSRRCCSISRSSAQRCSWPYLRSADQGARLGCPHRRRRAARAADRPLAEDRHAAALAFDWRDEACGACSSRWARVIGVSAAQISALINTQLARRSATGASRGSPMPTG